MLDVSKASKFEFGQFLAATVKWSEHVGYEVWVNNDPTLPGRVMTRNILAAGRSIRVRFSAFRRGKLYLIYMDKRELADETKAPPKPGGIVRWEEHLDEI
ncbi:MAG: hypothetical protein JST89_13130 [Cyanobacteria bacterium SZAS-4]|nr:hypothetical protein [Cyanobacteria bacterium SZAS-4]